MEILVCMKQVPDEEAEIALDPATGKPDTSKADPQGNAFDTYALELAVRLTEAHGGSVTVATVGGEESKICLKNALAVGAAKAFCVRSDGLKSDGPSVIAHALAAALPEMEKANGAPYDLILCGRETTDNIGGETGAYLAEKLGYPFVSNIVEAEPAEGGLSLKKELDEGYRMVLTTLPAAATVSKPDYNPRYPTIKSKLAARRTEIPDLTAEDAPARVDYRGFTEPPKRTAGVKLEEEDPAEAVRKAMDLLQKAKVL